MEERLKFTLIVLASAIVAVVLYIFLHESGHALVAAACGAKITSFRILGASTTSVGGNFSVFTASLHKAAGAALPLTAALIYMLFFFDVKRQGDIYRLFSMFCSLVPVMSLLAWIFVPFMYLAGNQDQPDDVIQLLNVSGLDPVVVASVSALLFFLAMWMAWKKGVIQIWLNIVRGSFK